MTLKEVLVLYSNKIEDEINKALTFGIKYMEAATIALLEDILTSDFHSNFCKEILKFVREDAFQENPDILAKMILEYYRCYKKLNEIISKSGFLTNKKFKYVKVTTTNHKKD